MEPEILAELTAEVVSNYVRNNAVPLADVPGLISSVYSALARQETNQAEPEPEDLKPAVPVKKSITPEYIVCLEDGKKFKSMKRHLALLGMTPEEYRARWNLDENYPMTAPAYAAKRSNLAKEHGLGQRRS